MRPTKGSHVGRKEFAGRRTTVVVLVELVLLWKKLGLAKLFASTP